MSKYTITETRTNYYKKPGTKGVWVEASSERTEVSEQHCSRIDESCGYFRRLGGTETVTRNYTSRGYRIVKLVSTSPDKSIRIIREYEIKEGK